ncbi:hypothetical protein D3C85_1296190 [compost metagenome]
MPAANEAAPLQEVDVATFRKSDFEDLERWADEVGVTTDELAGQILRNVGQALSRRRETVAVKNVVQFVPRR